MNMQTAQDNALGTRVVILEAAIEAIAREAETALDEPTVLFMTMCRISALARQALAFSGHGHCASDAQARKWPKPSQCPPKSSPRVRAP
jgi:hypothetical protein